MWFELQLPDWFKVANIKRYMRFTLAGWLIAALLGVGIYLTWYAARPAVATDDLASPTPALASEPDAQATHDVTPELTPEPAGG